MSLGRCNVLNQQPSESLPVPMGTAIVLAALLLEDEHLLVARVGDDLAPDDGALDERRADADGVAAGQQHFVELDRSADVAFDLLDANQRAGLDPVLLASSAYDGECHE